MTNMEIKIGPDNIRTEILSIESLGITFEFEIYKDFEVRIADKPDGEIRIIIHDPNENKCAVYLQKSRLFKTITGEQFQSIINKLESALIKGINDSKERRGEKL